MKPIGGMLHAGTGIALLLLSLACAGEEPQGEEPQDVGGKITWEVRGADGTAVGEQHVAPSGQDEAAPAGKKNAAPGGKKNAAPAAQKRVVPDNACAVFPAAVIRAEFALEAGVEITYLPSKHAPHRLCTVRWPKPDAAEIEQRSQAATQEYMQKKARGEEVKTPDFRTADEVSLNLYRGDFSSEAEARQSFDNAMAKLNEGIKGGTDEVQLLFQADTVPVDGVGDEAMWAEKLHQLSVVSGRQIFHLTVRTTGESADELAHARRLAQLVVSNATLEGGASRGGSID